MNSIATKSLKFKNLFRAHLSSHFFSTPAFVRMIPSDRCNLNCKYCWQKEDVSRDMTFAEFNRYVDKATKLKVGLITFLGGEPMMWDSIYDGISLCSRNHILTDMTTNGTLLTRESIDLLGQSGLDYLNISVDGLDSSRVSSKNSISKGNISDYLKEAKSKYRMHYRLNAVIYKNNFHKIKELIELSRRLNVQLSLGFIVPPLKKEQRVNQDIYFDQNDTELLLGITRYILTKKKCGYPIIDPDSYFQNIFRYLRKEKFWDCNYPSRYGWINVTPNGKIRSCTKKMDELDFNFLDLDRSKLEQVRKIMAEKVQGCNIDCYSNCAYDSFFYTKNKLQMLKKIASRFKP